MSGNFTLINRPKKGSVRQSALYKLMQADEARWRRLIEIPENRIKNPNSYIPAYLIDLEQSTAKNIFTGYTMSDRHIRIDEEFGTQNSLLANKKLCTHWHYTERFKKGADIITIHAYYHYNILLSVYKRVNDGDHLLVNDPELLATVRHNSIPAREKVHQLIELLKEDRATAEVQYNKIIDEINDIREFGEKSVPALREYLANCRACSDRLNDLNEDYADVRISLIERNINTLISAKQSKPVKQETPAVVVETTPPVTVVSTTVINTQAPAKVKVPEIANRDLKTEIKQLLDEYKNASVATLIKLEPKKRDLQFEVVNQYFTVTNHHTKLNLVRFERQLQELPKLIDILMQKCAASDAVAIKALHTAITSDEISHEFYFKLLENLLSNKLDVKQTLAFESLLQFLYATSDKYRLLITYIINLACKQTDDEPAITFSYLFSLYIESINNNCNLAIFKCLIKQAGDAQYWGLVCGKHKVSLLTAIASRDINGETMEFLISNGVNDTEIAWLHTLNIITSYKELRSSKQKSALSSFLPETKLRSNSAVVTVATDVDIAANRKRLHYIMQFASANSALFAYAIHDDTANIKVYKDLISTSNELSIFLGMSSIIARCRMIMLPDWAYNNRYKLFADNKERMQRVNEQLLQLNKDAVSKGAEFIDFYLWPKMPDAYGFINAVLQLLTAKIATFSSERILQGYEQCMRQGIEAGCAKNNQLALTCYYAALHALNSVVPQTAEIHQKIFKLIGRLALAHKQDTDSQFIDERHGYVKGHQGYLDNMLATSKFRKSLETPHSDSVTVASVAPNLRSLVSG
jgi:hypothetical protein